MSSDVDPKRDGLERFKAILQKGAMVTAIAGYTSPEGSRTEVAGFKGNNVLSQQRGDHALTWVQKAIGDVGSGSVDADVSPQGRSELYSGPDRPDGTEEKGRELEETAIAAFMGSDAEAMRRTQDVLDKMAAAKTTHGRAEVVYEQLRRAEITYKLPVTIEVPWSKTTPGHFADHPATCAPADDSETNRVFPTVIR
jgi:hypothetical protein